MPSVEPSTAPSFGPSVSLVPSLRPTVSLKPSVEPFTQKYKYMLEVEIGQLPGTELIEETIQSLINAELANAVDRNLTSAETITSNAEMFHRGRYLITVNIDSRKLSTCSQIINSTYCKEFEANFTLPGTLTSESTDGEKISLALKLVNETMVDMKGSEYGFINIYFLGGVIDSNNNAALDPSGIATANLLISSSGLSSAGTFMVTAASTLIVLFVFVVSRKKRHYNIAVTEGILDDDSLFGKDSSQVDLSAYMVASDDTEGTSTTSNDLRQQAHIIGEDSSVFSNPYEPDGRVYGLGSPNQSMSQQRGGLGLHSDNVLNVHKCTSTTCQICSNEQGPTFVSSDVVDLLSPNNQQQLEDIEQRSYVVPDTIDI